MARQMSKLDKRLMSSRQRVGRTNLYTNMKKSKKYAGQTLKTGGKIMGKTYSCLNKKNMFKG